MITLDKTKGILTLDGNAFDSSLTIAELKHAKQNLEVDLSIANAGWESYKAIYKMDGRLLRDFATWWGRPGGGNAGTDYYIRGYNTATVPVVR